MPALQAGDPLGEAGKQGDYLTCCRNHARHSGPLLLNTKEDNVPANGDIIFTDGLERSSNLRKDKEVAE
jgi:hypothetical protein